MTKIPRNRATYTRNLIDICKRLDKQHSGAFTWEHPFVHIEMQSRFTVNCVWVVGSFARGALTCGDLDLVAEIDWHGSSIALPYKVFKALSLRHQGVSLYDGTPDKNSSLVAFSDAIFIWGRRGINWRSAIDNIAPDPSATRFSRATDAIPFRPEQLACSVEELNNLLALRDKELIKWEFTPFSSTAIEGPPTDQQTEALGLFASCGSKSQFLLRHLLPFFLFHRWPSTYRRTQLNRNNFQLGDSAVSIGRPTVDT